MKASDRTILIALGVLAVIGAFVALVLMPKRGEASKLGEQVVQARSEAERTEQQLAFAVEAQKSFPANYNQLVTLGKAVPSDDDTSSLLVQLNGVARRTKVDFRAIELATLTSEAPPPSAQETQTDQSQEAEKGSEESAESQPVSVPATESSAASLPIGATVGSAGLSVMPYKLTFVGNFSRIGKFVDGIQRMVDPATGRVSVRGRLMTIDGFSMTRDEKLGFPHLQVSFFVTTYVAPQSQGLTAGATPQGPAEPAGSPSTSTISTEGATP